MDIFTNAFKLESFMNDILTSTNRQNFIIQICFHLKATLLSSTWKKTPEKSLGFEEALFVCNLLACSLKLMPLIHEMMVK